jgi:ubiquinone/menaquinone biosynthesis C-methylase UbiE
MKEHSFSEEEILAIKSGKKQTDFQEKGGFAERGLDSYKEMFNLDEQELEGKKILDVGPSLQFQREAKEKGINVVAVDQSFRRDAKGAEKFIEGSAQFLPFKNESFDEVLASNSVPLHIEKNDDVGALLSIYEMLRVVKKDGKVKIFPFTPKEIFEKEGKVVFNDPDQFPEAKRFTAFNLKDLLDQGNIPYDIKDVVNIERMNIKPKPWIKPGWEKAGTQFIVMEKNKESTLEPLFNEIKRLIEEQKLSAWEKTT